MKLRFLAALGGNDALTELAASIGPPEAIGLELAISRAGVSLWTVPGTPWRLIGRNEDILVGLVFDRSKPGRATEPDAEGDRREWEAATADQWGVHVLIRQDGATHSVLCDPSGTIPVYYGSSNGLHLYASDAAMLQLAWPRPMQPSIDYLRHWLSFPFLRGTRTGVDGVSEFVPGSRQTVDGANVRVEQCWSPAAHVAPRDTFSNFEEAADCLRTEVVRAVSSLAVEGESIALLLSGGLDSSILAAALTATGRPFRAITFATRARDGDERHFARLVAAHCGAELVELVEPEWSPDYGQSAASPLRPPGNPMLEPFRRAVALELSVSGSGILIDGAGGDNVFGQTSTTAPVRDALRQAGPFAALRAIQDIAALHGTTLWSISRAAMRPISGRHRVDWPSDVRFLMSEAVPPVPDDHPWFRGLRRCPPGKAHQIRMIAGIRHFLADPAAAAPATLHPLLAQPLLELCLAIPSWLSIRGGRDRAVARHAFRDILPQSVLQRRGKGRLESLFLTGFVKSREKLESFLLDGRLRACGLLDPDAVASYLRRTEIPRDHDYLRLLEIAGAEQWLRSFDRGP